MNKKILGVISCIIVVGVLVSGCTQIEEAGNLEEITMQLNWVHQAQFAGMYVADQKGFYEEEGINVSFLERESGENEIDLVFSGEADFGLTWGVGIFNAEVENKSLTAIAVIYQISPAVHISLKESGIEKPQDFVNKKVGVRPGSGSEIRYIAMLKNLGINSSNVIEIPVGYNTSMLYTGKVDVYPGYLTNEVIEAEEKGYEVNVINSDEYGVHIYTNILFTTDEMITNNSDLVQRFLNATIKGWRYAIENPEEAGGYSLLYDKGLNLTHEIKMMKIQIPLIHTGEHEIGWMSPSIWMETQNILLDQEILEEEIDIDKLYTMQFLNNI